MACAAQQPPFDYPARHDRVRETIERAASVMKTLRPSRCGRGVELAALHRWQGCSSARARIQQALNGSLTMASERQIAANRPSN